MKFITLLTSALFAIALPLPARVVIDTEAFGESLGGWKKRSKKAAEYPLSGSTYRTYKPEVTPTPEGGAFVSVRIDHVRGWMSSDDHAILELTVNSKGGIVSAQSSIAIQGRSIKSDVILDGTQAGKAIFSPEGAVQVGTDLVANLSAKLLRENIVEAGRVTLPAVLRHNYNLLFQAIRVQAVEVPSAVPVPGAAVLPPVGPPAPLKAAAEKPKEPAPTPLQIKPYGSPTTADLPKN
jgi:hypothetical protein